MDSSFRTGESDHSRGLSVYGNENNVKNFRFACSFAFSLIEQLIGNNIVNNSEISTVTLGLICDFVNGKNLNIIYDNEGNIILKIVNSSDYLIYDGSTGIVRDIHMFNIFGTSCFHDCLTENIKNYAEDLIVSTLSNREMLNNILNFSKVMCPFFMGVSLDSVVVAVETGSMETMAFAFDLTLTRLGIVGICALIFFFIVLLQLVVVMKWKLLIITINLLLEIMLD